MSTEHRKIFLQKEVIKFIEIMDTQAMAPYFGELSFHKKYGVSDAVVERGEYSNYHGLYGRTSTLGMFEEAFQILHKKGNTRLIFQQKLCENRSEYSDIEERYKNLYFVRFRGNRTRDNISLFIEFEDEMVVKCIDAIKVKRRHGSVPLYKQVLVFPLDEGF